jgi:hypothetical protein
MPTRNASIAPFVSSAMLVLLAMSLHASAQVQVLTDEESVGLGTTFPVEIASLDVSGENYDVSLNAHCYLEVEADSTGRYEFTIRRNSFDGEIVGRTFWRPGLFPETMIAEPLYITGFDADQSGNTTYVLVGRKFDNNAADAVITLRGFNAATTAASDGATVGAQELTFGSPATINSDFWVTLETFTVDAATPFDVRLTAHAYFELFALGSGDYELAICRDTAGGPIVGRGVWRPGDNDADVIADTIGVTGFDPGREQATIYVLCARKPTTGPPDATVYLRGLNAYASPADSGEIDGAQNTTGETDFISTNQWVTLDTISFDDAGLHDVELSAHLSAERAGAGESLYEIAIFRDACGTDMLGRTFWMPGEVAEELQADTLTLTAYDIAYDGPASYLLCARTFIGSSPPLTVFAYGLHGRSVGVCPGDINGDDVVDVVDLLALLSAWGQSDVPEDLDGDGIVGVGDLLTLLASWGPCP